MLLLFGGEELRGFALALFIGILLGTYSSIFVSAPIVVLLRQRFPAKKRAVSAARYETPGGGRARASRPGRLRRSVSATSPP